MANAIGVGVTNRRVQQKARFIAFMITLDSLDACKLVFLLFLTFQQQLALVNSPRSLVPEIFVPTIMTTELITLVAHAHG